MTHRHWVFTYNNPPPEWRIPEWIHLRYASYQLEQGEQKGTMHVQGYVELSRASRLQAVRTHLAPAHWEPRRGTRDQARAYSMKPETRVAGPWEFGSFETIQGSRSDLKRAVEELKEGGIAKVAVSSPEMIVKYHKGLTVLLSLMQTPRCSPTLLKIYWGPPGSGKSSRAFMEYPQAYWKPPDNKWWDGYQGQKAVIMDDFSPDQVPLGTMLRLIDRYPLQLEVKGGFVHFVAEVVVITSNTDPTQWYGAAPQWIRRITLSQKI